MAILSHLKKKTGLMVLISYLNMCVSPVFAQIVHNTPTTFLTNFEMIKSLSGGSLSEKSVKDFLSKANAYAKDKKNAKNMQSPDGKKLQHLITYLSSTAKAQRLISDCIMNGDTKEIMSNSVNYYSNATCYLTDPDTMGTFQQTKRVNGILQYVKDDESERADLFDMLRKLTLQAQKDALATAIDLRYRYSSINPKYKNLDTNQLIVETLEPYEGKANYSFLKPAARFELETFAKEYLGNLKLTGAVINPDEAMVDINDRIQKYKKAFPQIVEKYKAYKKIDEKFTGVIKFKPGFKEQKEFEESEKNYNAWSQDEVSAMSSQPWGTLMFSDTMSSYFKPALKFSPDNIETVLKPFPQGAAGRQVMNKALEEAIAQTKRYGMFVGNNAWTYDLFSSDHKIQTADLRHRVKKLLRNSPSLAGQLLLTAPKKNMLICQLINEAQMDKEREADEKERFVYGTMIIGAALAVVSLGTSAVASAGIVADTMLGVYLTATSSLLAVASTSTLVADAIAASSEKDKEIRAYSGYRAAYFAMNGRDFSRYLEMKKAWSEYQVQSNRMIMDVGFLGLDLIFMGKVLKGLSVGDRIIQVKNTTQFMKSIESQSAMALKAKKLLGNTYVTVFSHLSLLKSEEAMTKLNAISKMDADQIQKFKKGLSKIELEDPLYDKKFAELF